MIYRASTRVPRALLLVTTCVIVCGCVPTKVESPPALSLVPSNLIYPSNPNGYIPLIPIRADFGPGFVFSGKQAQGGDLIISQIVCNNLYPSIAPANVPVVLTNRSYTSKNNAGLTLSLLKKLIGDNSASFDAKYSASANYNVTLGSASETYISVEQIYGTVQKVDANCQNAIDQLKMRQEFKDSVFIVSRALTVNGLAFDFDRSNDASAKLTLELKDYFTANPNVGSTVEDKGKNTTIDVKQDLRLGVRVDVVDDWEPSGAVAAGGASAVIKAHPSTAYRIKAN